MFFGFKNKSDKSSLRTLSEEDIRSRLYGSAVGMAMDIQEEFPKKHKGREEKALPIKAEFEDERIKIQKELESLKRDLEQTRRKLNRMRGLGAKKIRLLAIYLAGFLIAVILATIFIKHLVSTPRATDPVVTTTESGAYSIQAAVYGDAADAKKFSSALSSKGYKAFIGESRFKSGKVKFIVYVGRFKDNKEASKVLSRLKTKEGIGDSFITSIQE